MLQDNAKTKRTQRHAVLHDTKQGGCPETEGGEMTASEKKLTYCEHCGSYEGPLVYKRELGAYYCIGHASLAVSPTPSLYTPVEKPYRIVKYRPDGFIVEIIDSDTPYSGPTDGDKDEIYIDKWSCSTVKACD